MQNNVDYMCFRFYICTYIFCSYVYCMFYFMGFVIKNFKRNLILGIVILDSRFWSPAKKSNDFYIFLEMHDEPYV